MNLAAMETEVFRRLEEVQGSPVRWSATDVVNAINEGLEELSDISEFYERYATIHLRTNASYYDLRSIVPDTILRVTNIFNPSNNTWLKPIDTRDLDYKTARQWELVPGEPLKYQMRGLWWLGVYPAGPSSSGLIRVYYKALHPALTDSNQEPEQLPEDYHTNIVDYAMYTLLADDMETTQAALYWNRFKQAADQLADQCFPGGRASRSRIPGMGSRG